MPTISVSEARNQITQALVAVFRQRIQPTPFLRSFFPAKEYGSKLISIEVRRGTERVAADVVRGTEGNRNTFSRSTLKQYMPPAFREYCDATDSDLYDRLYNSTGDISEVDYAAFIEELYDKLLAMRDKIDRAYELQCAQVLTTGIVTLNSGVNIDFKRKAGSLVDLGSGAYWAAGGVDPVTSLTVGARFLRETGKSQGAIVNVLCGRTALADLINNAAVQSRGKLVSYALDGIAPPQRDAVGASLHGQITVGSWLANLWAYPEVYEDSTGTVTDYLDPKKVIMLPEKTNFKLSFAAVNQLLTDGGPVKKGAYIFGDFKDTRKATHEFDVQSAGIAIPVAVDQIWTAKVVA
jgi:hypothetical protein